LVSFDILLNNNMYSLYKSRYLKFKNFKIAILASIGSGFEYYDFIIYGMMAKYIAIIFFPLQSELLGIMKTFAIFAAGYFIRPIGGTIFGILADVYGRKKIFIVVMLMMSCSTFGIGIMPTYNQIGIFSPIFLIICRLLQGISYGAELPNAITIISETSEEKNLGKFCSLVLSCTSIGALIAAVTLSIISSNFTHEEIIDYAWRIPFILGGSLAIISYIIRVNLPEIKEMTYSKFSKKSLVIPLINLFKYKFKDLLIALGLAFFLATLVIINIYLPVWILEHFNYTLTEVYEAMTLSMITSFLFMLFFGWLSDIISKFKLLRFSIIGVACSLYPMYIIIDQKCFYSIKLFFIFYQFWISCFYTSYMPILSNLFASEYRCTAIAIVINAAFALASLIPLIESHIFSGFKSPLSIGVFFLLSVFIGLVSYIGITIQNTSIDQGKKVIN